MFRISGIGAALCGMDVEIGNMPVFDEVTESIGGVEALKLPEPLDCQNVWRTQPLLLGCQLGIVLQGINFIGNGCAFATGKIEKIEGRTIATALVAQTFVFNNCGMVAALANFEPVSHKPVLAMQIHTDLQFNQYCFGFMSARNDFPESAALGQCLPDISGQTILQKPENIEECSFTNTVCAQKHAKPWYIFKRNILERLEIFQADRLDIHQGNSRKFVRAGRARSNHLSDGFCRRGQASGVVRGHRRRPWRIARRQLTPQWANAYAGMSGAGSWPGRDREAKMSPAHWPSVLIFDCDGVLVDSELVSLSETRHAFQEEGYVLSLEEVRERFLGLSGQTMLERAQREMGRQLPDGFHARLTQAIILRYESELEGIAGIRDALREIGARVCVASSSPPDRILRSLEIVGYSDLFEPHLFSASAVEHGKPWPDLFLHAAREMGAVPAECLVIEDSVPGVLAAGRAGIPVYGFTGGSHLKGTSQARHLREAGAMLVFEDMRQLPGLILQNRMADTAQAR